MRASKVGIREFRSGLAEFIASASPVAVTRHGQTVGFFIPAHGHADADLAALKEASAAFDRLLADRSVDVQPVTTDSKPVRKAGKAPMRKAAGSRCARWHRSVSTSWRSRRKPKDCWTGC